MPLIGAVSDDLTGGTTVGVLLAKSGSKTAVFFNEKAALESEGLDKYQSVIISSNSRPLTPEEAYEKVNSATKALKKMGVKYFSKRTDTTLRGGIGYEIDAMLDELGEDYVAIVVPSMPQSRRILVGGFSIIEGTALIKTPAAQDVRTPVHENFIPRLLASQTKRKVGLITLDTVLEGKESIKVKIKNLIDEDIKVIIIDSITTEDIIEISSAVIEMDLKVLAVDPGALTKQLAVERKLISDNDISQEYPDVIEENKIVIIAAGSATPVTKKQMENLCSCNEKHMRISVNPEKLIQGGDVTLNEVKINVEKVKEIIKQKPRVILLETALHGSLLDLNEQDRIHGYEEGMSANRINSALGHIISKVLEEVGRDKFAGIYMTGGDTMVNVCYQLGVECIELVDYVIPQADIGRLVGGKFSGMPVVGKGGLTGTDDTAIEIVERLFKESCL